MRNKERLVGGLSWPESPRWRDGELFISDVHNYRVVKVGADRSVKTVCQVEGRPAGMDFAADGSLLLATGLGRQLLSVDPQSGQMETVADLRQEVKAHLNDLITHDSGWSWFGDTGFRFGTDEPTESGSLWAFHPRHRARPVVHNMAFPNGLVITPDGARLYVAETFGKRISVFDIGDGGALLNRRIHASLPDEPDGLCMDAQGSLWVALLFRGDFLRVAPDGAEIERVAFPGKNAVSCTTGGTNRRSLFMCVCTTSVDAEKHAVRHGEVFTAELVVAGAGRP